MSDYPCGKIHRVEQGTEEWKALRVGKVTASRIADVMAQTKSGYGASRKNYMAELLCERMTGVAVEGYQSPEMRWGTEQEPFARGEYEIARDVDVEQIGFVDHPVIPRFGASPDGFVAADGSIEAKCPNTATHIAFLRTRAVDRKYVLQAHGVMMCGGRAWCDFVSYDKRMPEGLRLGMFRIERDANTVAEIEREVQLFLKELDALEAELRAKIGEEWVA